MGDEKEREGRDRTGHGRSVEVDNMGLSPESG